MVENPFYTDCRECVVAREIRQQAIDALQRLASCRGLARPEHIPAEYECKYCNGTGRVLSSAAKQFLDDLLAIMEASNGKA